VRSDRIRAEDIWVEKAKNTPNIKIYMNTQATEILGNFTGVTGLRLHNGENISLDGVFVAIGSTPFTKIVDDLQPDKDDEGCVIVNVRQETSIQ
jgi:thioredoxin reductase